MTRGELRTAILARCVRPNAGADDQALVNRVINQVLREVICARHNWTGMAVVAKRNTTQNVPLYSWPADDPLYETYEPGSSQDWKDTEVIVLQSSDTSVGQPLSQITPWVFLHRFPIGGITGYPVTWTREGNAFRLGPTPNSSLYVLTVYGWRFPADLSDDADSNWATKKISRLIDLWATAYCLEYFGEPDRAGRLRQEAESELQFQIQNDRLQQAPAHQNIEPSRASGRPASNVKRGAGVRRYGYNYFG